MKKLFLMFFILTILISGCSVNMGEKSDDNENTNVDIKNNDTNKDIPVNENEKEKSIEDMISEQIEVMSLDEKIGQLLISGFEGPEISQRERELIETYKIGGFILFQRNIISYEQTLRLLNSLKDLNSNNKIPLLLSIDEEGGRVSRLDKIFKNLEPVSNLGLKNNEKLAFEYGQIQALKLLALGFNLNFSPVLDVNSNPKNVVIGNRAISDDPEKVALLGTQIFKSMMESGIIPVGKHYPGHGDTLLDSHYNMPIITKSKNELEKVEFLPFKKAIKNGIPGLMVGHLYLEALSNEPASLSTEIITDILRKEQDFDGVVFSDDLTMGAISDTYDIGDAAVKFIKAGGDIALICHNDDNIFRVINSIEDALAEGQITQYELDEKVFRILNLKKRFNLEDQSTVAIDIDGLNNKINKYLEEGE
ncbi:MAG: beta-N-acetylhexosaminidase [Gudongella sp.]|nr:beta-N-acetylhexosaminidase [Gudongella sp.]